MKYRQLSQLCCFSMSSFEQSNRSYLTFFYNIVPFGVSPPRVMKWPFTTEAWRREGQGRSGDGA